MFHLESTKNKAKLPLTELLQSWGFAVHFVPCLSHVSPAIAEEEAKDKIPARFLETSAQSATCTITWMTCGSVLQISYKHCAATAGKDTNQSV